MILNRKSFSDYKEITSFVNREKITEENILAIVPRGQFEVHLFWWGDRYYV